MPEQSEIPAWFEKTAIEEVLPSSEKTDRDYFGKLPADNSKEGLLQISEMPDNWYITDVQNMESGRVYVGFARR